MNTGRDLRRRVLRPSIPHLAYAAAACWIGMLVAEMFSWRIHIGEGTGRAPSILLVAGIVVSLALRRTRLAAWVMFALCAGLASGSLFYADTRSAVSMLETRTSGRVILDVDSDPEAGRFGYSSVATARFEDGLRARVRVQWPDNSPPPQMGRSVDAYVVVEPCEDDSWSRLSLRKGISGTATVRISYEQRWTPGMAGIMGRVRSWATAVCRDRGGAGGELVASIVLGDRTGIKDTPVEDDFRITGLSHLIAISGSHLMLVAALVQWLLSCLGAGRRGSALTTLSVLAAFVALTGALPSAVRAFAMTASTRAGALVGRRADSLATLGTCTCLLLLVDPRNAHDLGFALSVAAVAGLVLLSGLVREWASCIVPRRWTGATDALSLTLAAQIATMPVAVPVFSTLSLIAPLANVVVGPMVVALLNIAVIGLVVSAVSEPVGAPLIRLAGVLASCSERAASLLARFPGAQIAVDWSAPVAGAVCLTVLVALWISWPAPTKSRAARSAVAVLAACALAFYLPGLNFGEQIVVMDVGQADAILLRSGSRAALFDVGGDSVHLGKALARCGVRSLDAVILSHLHADHTGGLDALRGTVAVDAIYVARGVIGGVEEADTLRSANALVGEDSVVEVTAGDRIEIGAFSLDILWPEGSVVDPSANESSVVVLVRNQGFSALLTGDAESDVLRKLVSIPEVADLDLLKVGHHGSAESVDDGVLDILDPGVAVISVGERNRFGHPASSTLTLLRRNGVPVRRTDLSGDIVVKPTSRGFEFATER